MTNQNVTVNGIWHPLEGMQLMRVTFHSPLTNQSYAR